MGWIKENEIHRCDKPEYDAADPHKVGEHWQCENIRCNQLWYIATMGISTFELGGEKIREGFYAWAKVSHKEYRWP